MSDNKTETKEREWDVMLSGRPYNAFDPELVEARDRARDLVQQINATTSKEEEKRNGLFKELIGEFGEGVYITPPFFCDYVSYN